MSANRCILAHDKTLELLDLDLRRGHALVNEITPTKGTRKVSLTARDTIRGPEIVYDLTRTVMHLYGRYFKTADLYDLFYHEIATLDSDSYLVLTYHHEYRDHHVLVYIDLDSQRIVFASAETKRQLFSVKCTANVALSTYLQRIEHEIRSVGYKIFHLTGVVKRTKNKALVLRHVVGEFRDDKVPYFILALSWNNESGAIVVTKDFITLHKVPLSINGLAVFMSFGENIYAVPDLLYDGYDILSFKKPLFTAKDANQHPVGAVLGVTQDFVSGDSYVHMHNPQRDKAPFLLGKKGQTFRKLKIRRSRTGPYIMVGNLKVPLDLQS